MRFLHFIQNGIRGIAVNDPADAETGFRGFTTEDQHFPGFLDDLLRAEADLQDVQRILRGGRTIDLGNIVFLPPILRPSKIVCVGLNYADHVRETNLKAPDYPELFARFSTSLTGHEAPLLRPRESTQLDFESELAFVIGRRGRRIAHANALDHVAGYSIFNDATLRDFQFRTPQWTVGKNFDSTGACGPWMVTPEDLPPGASGLAITGRLNGEVMQSSNTGMLIFDVAKLIELVSAVMTLEAGDIFITGTPGGVGLGRSPKVYMSPGDRFEVEIESIGTLANTIVED